jgi:flavin reductase (DIM6/NTAB) family NADH-FMN oxidoreductase RutF
MPASENEFRATMSLYPTGVCVVSAQVDDQAPFGITVNSFTSLSLEPPLVMWNLQKTSDKYKEWRDAEYFAVNMLRADQEHLSQTFSMRGQSAIDETLLHRGGSGCPILSDCLATLECKVHARYEEGDHVVVIGEVLNVKSDPESDPLTFHKGTYGTVDSGSR